MYVIHIFYCNSMLISIYKHYLNYHFIVLFIFRISWTKWQLGQAVHKPADFCPSHLPVCCCSNLAKVYSQSYLSMLIREQSKPVTVLQLVIKNPLAYCLHFLWRLWNDICCKHHLNINKTFVYLTSLNHLIQQWIYINSLSILR